MLHKLGLLIARLRTKQDVKASTLTRDQLNEAATLRTYGEWSALLAWIDETVALKAEALMYEHDPARNAFVRGQITALRELPVALERLAISLNDTKQRDQQRVRDDQLAQRRTAALYGTPSWPDRPGRAAERP